MNTRFWAKVDKSVGQGPKGECWCWTASQNDRGYGQFSIDGRPVIASRFAYSEATGDTLTKTDVIRHECDYPPCVRPSHLTKGTHQENVADRVAKGRTRTGHLYGNDHPNSKLTPDIVRFIRTSDESTTTLGPRFGVDPSIISRIRRRVIWRHVE